MQIAHTTNNVDNAAKMLSNNFVYKCFFPENIIKFLIKFSCFLWLLLFMFSHLGQYSVESNLF